MIKNIERVAVGKSWLAQAAKHAAISLPLVEVVPGQSAKQLILVRFAKPSSLNQPFIWKHIAAGSANGFPAMWSDSVSEYESELTDIAAFCSVHWVALQVIRVGLPDDFEIPRKRNVSGGAQATQQLMWEYPEDKDWSREFFVRLDIPSTHVATIPIKFESNMVVPNLPQMKNLTYTFMDT